MVLRPVPWSKVLMYRMKLDPPYWVGGLHIRRLHEFLPDIDNSEGAKLKVASLAWNFCSEVKFLELWVLTAYKTAD